MTDQKSSYAQAGVDIEAGNRSVELMKAAVQATHGPEVLAGVGSFGGLFSAIAVKEMEKPVLVASTDGVGTKVMLAAQSGRYAGIGKDIVNHCVDDILVQGARPLFFLDYFASSKLEPEVVAEIVGGMAKACQEAGCALLGGETAEMPGVYHENHFDVAGTIVGVLDQSKVLPRLDIQPGDLLVGLTSSGPHTNGYSLIRRVFANVLPEYVYPELGAPLADFLLEPHRNYLPVLEAGLKAQIPKGLAHITGGGFIDNLPRILPEGCGAVIRKSSWEVPALFQLIQRLGDINLDEMYRVFNMGIGMVAVVASEQLVNFQRAVREPTYVIGEVVAGEGITLD
jgi:phosphoribosylformylglycinamidine cyclo-ligase/phosphoribosylamine--glycine ligase/phosphoribosylformylglycinamidine cyclo-ligase